jgi:SSS family solute:Na+ symporter
MNQTTIVGTALDYWIIIGYFVAIFGFGFMFAKFTRSTKDFFFGGQRFAWWLIAFSYIASVVGSYSFIKYSAVGFTYGMSSTMTYLNDWIIMSFLLLGWLPIVYFSKSASAPEYFYKRFDDKSRAMATIIILIYMVGYIGINLYTMGVALNAMLGTDVFWSGVVIALVCAVYVTAGGQTSVIMTDLVQAIILLVAGFLLFGLGLGAIGGWDRFWNALPVLHKLPFAQFNEPHKFHFSGIFWQDGIANNFVVFFMNQGFLLRFLALKSVKEAKKTFLVFLLVMMPLAAFAVANAGWLGTAMVTVGLLPEDLNANQVFVSVAEKVCGPGVFGFVMAALTAALMSTVDTLINAVSVVVVNDVYKPYIKKNAPDKHYLKVARIVSLSSAIIGIALIPVFAQFSSIYAAHGSFIATVTPPMVVAVLLGFTWKRYTSAAAFWTLLGGSIMIGISIIWPVLITPFAHGVDPAGGFKYMRALYGLVCCGTIAVIVTMMTKPKPFAQLDGLVLGTIRKAQEKFKGGKINDEPGRKVVGPLAVKDSVESVSASSKMMEEMKAHVGDLVYVEDARKWLGGLRSIHGKITAVHSDSDPSIYIAPYLINEGELIEGRKHRMEKLF